MTYDAYAPDPMVLETRRKGRLVGRDTACDWSHENQQQHPKLVSHEQRTFGGPPIVKDQHTSPEKPHTYMCSHDSDLRRVKPTREGSVKSRSQCKQLSLKRSPNQAKVNRALGSHSLPNQPTTSPSIPPRLYGTPNLPLSSKTSNSGQPPRFSAGNFHAHRPPTRKGALARETIPKHLSLPTCLIKQSAPMDAVRNITGVKPGARGERALVGRGWHGTWWRRCSFVRAAPRWSRLDGARLS